MKTEAATEYKTAQKSEREFRKYTFFKVDSQWRNLSDSDKSKSRQEFTSIVNHCAKDHQQTALFTCVSTDVEKILDQLG